MASKGKQRKKIQKLKIAAAKREYVRSLNSKSIAEIAIEIKLGSKTFLEDHDWRTLRQRVLDHYGSRCMCCLRLTKRPNVDHIKPRKYYPELAKDFDNLQVLCGRCNKEKGNKNMIDYRPKSLVALILNI